MKSGSKISFIKNVSAVQISVIAMIAVNLAVFFGHTGINNKDLSTSAPSDYVGLSENLEKLSEKEIILVSPISEFRVDKKELQTWLETYNRNYTGKQEMRFNREAVQNYLDDLAQKIDSPPVNARLIIENGKATEFSSPKKGFRLDTKKSTANIILDLAKNETASTSLITLEIIETEPGVTLEKLNSLGIKTLLAKGESDFTGSPKSRAHNINTAAKVFTGIILKPGEDFSFNNFLGTVDATTGYLPELVIKNGQLIPEYGGGICQVSTTLFRAAAFAGLPIIERRPHSLPVRYYNPQGFDATIYPGASDLRFKNDTSAHVLIQSKIIGSKIYFEIYGTADGRSVAIDGPRQYDLQPNGALKAVLNRTVTYTDGTEKKDEFRSSYKSPSLFPTVRNPLE